MRGSLLGTLVIVLVVVVVEDEGMREDGGRLNGGEHQCKKG